MNTRPFGVGWYSLAPTILATAERVPSAPTTTGALSSPAAVVTPATRPRSITSPVPPAWFLPSPPAAAAALTRISSSVIRRTLRTGAPVIPGTSSTTATASSKIIRPRIIGGATFSSASRTPMRSSTWTPAGWIACVDSVSLGKRSLSTTQTRRPARASIAASGAPAQRAPTTMTSKDSPHALTRRTVSVLHRFRADAIALRSEECWLSLRATDWPAALGVCSRGAQARGSVGERDFPRGGSRRGCGGRAVAADGLALVAPAGRGRRPWRPHGRRRGWGSPACVRALRHRGAWHAGADRTDRAARGRRAVSACPQPDVRGRWHDDRRPGAAARAPVAAGVRGRVLARRGHLRARLRGADPARPLRRGVRGVPARRPGLVAPPAPLVAGAAPTLSVRDAVPSNGFSVRRPPVGPRLSRGPRPDVRRSARASPARSDRNERLRSPRGGPRRRRGRR